MTQQEALKEAQRRWGLDAIAYIGRGFFLVGSQSDYGGKNEATGISKVSWEDAFAYADRREKERTT